MSKKSVEKNIPIATNLIRQNCFVRESVRSDCSVTQPSSFLSCDEVVEDDGVKVKFTEHDYPITPEYVDSFVDSSDYRNDPIGSIAAGQNRRNLGDVSQMQSVGQMDMSQARELYNKLREVFSKTFDTPPSSDLPSSDTPPSSDEGNK